MTETLKFDEDKVNKLEEDFRKITLDKQTKNMIKMAGQLLGSSIPLSEMAIMGNGWYSLKEWQVENKMNINDALTDSSPLQMKKIYKELLDIGKRRMRKMLKKPDEQEALLDEAFNKVLLFLSKTSKEL